MRPLLLVGIAAGLTITGWGISDLARSQPVFTSPWDYVVTAIGGVLALGCLIWLIALIVGDRRKPGPDKKAVGDNPPTPRIEVSVVQPSNQPLTTNWTGRPASLGDGFVGRDEQLAAITKAFDTHRAVVISGAHRHWSHYPLDILQEDDVAGPRHRVSKDLIRFG